MSDNMDSSKSPQPSEEDDDSTKESDVENNPDDNEVDSSESSQSAEEDDDSTEKSNSESEENDPDDDNHLRSDSSKNSDSSKVNDNTCEDPMLKWERKRMEEKFHAFKRTRSDFPDFSDDSWYESLKEEKYWLSRFEEEYLKLGDESEDSELQLVADIADYYYWITHRILFESDKYSDDYDCAELMYKPKINRVRAISRNLKREIEAAKHDDGFDEWSKEDKEHMNNKFMDFVKEYFTRDLSKDYSYIIEFDDDLKEAEYWVARFDKEYEKMIRRRGDIREHLAAYIHYYVEKFSTARQCAYLTYPVYRGFLVYLKIWD